MNKRYSPPVQGTLKQGNVNISVKNLDYTDKLPEDGVFTKVRDKPSGGSEFKKEALQSLREGKAQKDGRGYNWTGGVRHGNINDYPRSDYVDHGNSGLYNYSKPADGNGDSRSIGIMDRILRQYSVSQVAKKVETEREIETARVVQEVEHGQNEYRYETKGKTVSFIDKVKNMFAPSPKEKAPTEQAIGFDEDKPLFKDDIITFVKDELQRRKDERKPLEHQWILNSNFLSGNQYCDINTYTGEIMQVEPVYDWLERETFNRIAPLVETRIANLKQINYIMSVKPMTNELDDYSKAEVSTAVLRHIQQSTGFDAKKDTMILWSELCGNAFCLSWWDNSLGVGGDGVAVGDLNYGLLTPFEVYPESIYTQGVEAQRSIIISQVKSVKEIYDLYGVKLDGREVTTFSLTPMPVSGGFGYEGTVNTLGNRSVKESEEVITYFEKANRDYPRGRLIIVAGDQIIYYGDLPYDRIPIVHVFCKEVPGQFFGKSCIEELIPLQRAYNACVNRIHEYIKNIALNSYMVEEDSIDIDDFVENGKAPGAALVYRKGYAKPEPIRIGALPSEVLREKQELQRDMEYVASVSQLMAIGDTPNGVNSGRAIDSLRDIDNTRLSLVGDNVRNAMLDLAKLWLSILKRYAVTYRVLKSVGANAIGSAVVWSNEDITDFDVSYETENELILTEEVQKQRFMEAFQMGLFYDEQNRIPERFKSKALELMKTGNYRDMDSISELQRQAACRENVFFENGVMPRISDFDDHRTHFEEHLRFVLQMKFRVLSMKKPELAAAFEWHVKGHMQAMIRG